MKTLTIDLYSFEELSKEAQQTVLNNLSDINVRPQWDKFLYNKAREVRLHITSFNNDYHVWHVWGYFGEDGMSCANKIIATYDKTCESYKLSEAFISDWKKLEEELEKLSEASDGNEDEFEKLERKLEKRADDLENEYLQNLLQDYGRQLKEEYESLTGEAAIIETIKSNGYTFEANGTMRNA